MNWLGNQSYVHDGTTCESCHKQLEARTTRFKLVMSPNAEWLHGTDVKQGKRWEWAKLCTDCFGDKAAVAPTETVPAKLVIKPFPDATTVHKVESNSHRGKFYVVAINASTGRVECDCPHGRYRANQSQQDFCKHAMSVLRESVHASNSA